MTGHEQEKRAARMTQARLCVKRAERYTSTRPHGEAVETIRDMRLAIKELLEELEYKPHTAKEAT